LETIVVTLPDRYKLMALLAAWCAMRFGELTELRRGDIDLHKNRVSITRGVVRANGAFVVGEPKSDAGVRDVAIPPHLIPALEAHLKKHTGARKDALLFPAAADSNTHMAPSTLYKVYYPARKAAGRDDLRWHDLRHTGAVLAAQTGATLAELMNRLGHSTPGAAMRYQHAAEDRDTEIARRLSALAASANGEPAA
jgi:integrase